MIAVAADEPAWMLQAACRRGVDPDVFFAPGADNEAEALAVCRRCEVRDHCLAHALEHGEHHGIWGGRTEQQLIAIRRDLERRSRRRA